jgi:signal transduction histidine kinase
MIIYTPGSNSGVPGSVLQSFQAPSEQLLNDSEGLRDRIQTLVSSVLGLLGIEADPLRSREHILLSTIIETHWRQTKSLDIPALIHLIQKPPFEKVGVFDLESFYPAKDRLELAILLNNLVASPGFSNWLQGEPLDISKILYTASGTPRLSIFSIAHLSDSERMFFVNLLLNELLSWMRTQPGTSSLRAILYIDDEEQNLQGFKITFYDDFEIYTAKTVVDALDILEKNKINVVISDQRMPEMTGLEFLSIVNKKYKDIVCLILTAYADIEAVMKAINQGGVYRFLMKPWNEYELKITLNNAIERYSLRKDNKRLLENLKNKNKDLVESNRELTKATFALQERETRSREQNEELISLNEELTQTIDELAKAKEKAEESDKLKSAFLQNISHEIRTPMNAIVGFANLLKETEVSKNDLKKFTDIIINNSNQLLSIVNDILTISAIDTGLDKIKSIAFNLNDLLSELQYVFEPIAANKNVKISFKSGLTDLESSINTDKTKLQQVLTNLISNAIKFTIVGHIEFGYKLEKEFIKFYVADTGIGISPENQKAVFDRFYQVPNTQTGSFNGTGLGLAISKAQVELLGGKIWLESELYKGTTFFFTIPFEPSELLQEKQITETPIQSDHDQISILIAEDEMTNYLYLEHALKNITTKIIHAKNGKEAIELFRLNGNIKLILMDLKMPLIDGYEATRQLRQLNKNIPIIAQTAYTFFESKNKLLQAGFNDCIIKPIDRIELINLVRKYL